MRLIDNQGRLFGKVNLIDFLLILVVLGAVAFGVYKMTQGEVVINAPEKTVTVQFYGNALYPFVVENIKEGDTIRSLESNDVIGKIVKIDEVKEAINLVSTADGRTVISEIPDKYSIYFTVEGKASLVNNILQAGSTPLLAGHELKIKGTSFTMFSVISKVQTK
ncbi:MAG: DUF4330 domain-containing protein [Brevibacillus sp.]|nr:DUF4330 domain-containing protein [Brevibacillus sp.]